MIKQLRYKPWVIYLLYALAIAGVIALLGVSKLYFGSQKVANINIELKGKDGAYFIDEKDVERRIVTMYPGILKGAKVNQINEKLIEQHFTADPWIKTAEVYFDRAKNLIVKLEQTQPVARIITSTGISHYIDSAGRWLPMLNKLTARLPIITNYAVQKDGKPVNDSALKQGVIALGKLVAIDSFWQAQLAQVDIENNNNWVLVPTLGNHKAVLGQPINLEQKLNRLKKFYMQFGSSKGLNKYEKLLVQYDKQIVAIKKGELATKIVDSINARALMSNWDITQNNDVVKPIIINDTVDGSDDLPIINNAPLITPNPKPKNNLPKPNKPNSKPISKPNSKPNSNNNIKPK